MPERRIDDGAARRSQIDGDRVACGVTSDDRRVEVQLLGLERRVAVEIVGERLAEIFLDRRRQHDVPAQHIARRKADHGPHRRRLSAETMCAASERGPACCRDHRGVAGQRNRRRERHHRLAIFHRGAPQRRGIAGKDQHRTHPAARDRRTRRRRHQRVELALPPLPETGEPEPARVLLHTCSEGRQRPFTVGHRSRFLSG